MTAMRPIRPPVGPDEDQRPKDQGRTARRLLDELRPYRLRLVSMIFFIVLAAVAQAAGPWLVGRAIDREILQGDRAGLNRTMLLLLLVYGINVFAVRGQFMQIGLVGQRLLATLRERIFDQFQRLPLGYFDRRPLGDLMSRIINDVDTLNTFFSQGLVQILSSIFGLVTVVIAMFVLNVQLALASFTMIPAMFLVTIYFGRRARKAYRTTRETVGDVTAGLQEEITGAREAQAFNRAEFNVERFRERNAANRDANIEAIGVTAAFSPAINVLSTVALAIVIGYGGYLVFEGAMTLGLLAAFLLYVQGFFRPIQMIAQSYTQVQSSLAGGERIFAILDEEPEPPDRPDARELERVEGRIEFARVSFSYEPGHSVLHDVSFVVEPGQTVALVGRTGAGKTTIANLIPRFYDVTKGAVLIDGHDVRDLTRASLRSNIAMVLQEPFLFSGTIADNIGYGRLAAGQEEIEAAARIVHAHDFITALPDGYATELTENGGMLSQGQRQLLSFARAVLADPRILILDEATSNIDTRTERLIQRALVDLLAGRTSVVIAHRLSTIRRADLILVIDAGQIIEQGSHETLLATGGLYAELYRRQFRDTRPAAEREPTDVPAGLPGN